MGSGKSAVGAFLARRLGLLFVDLDEAVEARLGMTIREVFSRLGEPAFRAAERAELEATVSRTDLVVATGGGVFAAADNRELIRQSGGVSVFLDVPWEVICRRLGATDPDRPLWTDEDRARSLFVERRPHYRRATFIVELAGDEPPASVADRICARFQEARCAS